MFFNLCKILTSLLSSPLQNKTPGPAAVPQRRSPGLGFDWSLKDALKDDLDALDIHQTVLLRALCWAEEVGP